LWYKQLNALLETMHYYAMPVLAYKTQGAALVLLWAVLQVHKYRAATVFTAQVHKTQERRNLQT
jgi:hypothetical protein